MMTINMAYIIKSSKFKRIPWNIINEDLIPKDQAQLSKEVQKVEEARKEGQWGIIRNKKDIIRDIDKKHNKNKYLRHSGSYLGTIMAFP